MTLPAVTLPYGIRDIKLTPFTTPAATTPSTAVDLPYGRTLSFSEAEDFEELRGDDGVVTQRGKGPLINWDLEAGGISLPAYAIIAGGTVTDSGTAGAMKRKYQKKKYDSRPFFKIEGQAISDSGGDVHGIIYRARCTSNIEGSMSDGTFFLTKASGAGFGSFETGSLDALYDFVQNEAAIAIT